MLLAAAAATRALKLHTPTKWNGEPYPGVSGSRLTRCNVLVEHVNLLTWDFDADEDSKDPEQFSAQLRHPFFINGSVVISRVMHLLIFERKRALAILGFARTVDGGALVYLPGLPTRCVLAS